jgi:hypothetical protein
MWGKCDGRSVTEQQSGLGKVVWGRPLAQVLAELNLKPDFEHTAASGAQLAYIHRRDGEADIYFVSNQRGRFDAADCTFRVSGKLPELWDPETGRMGPAAVWREEAGRTVVPLSFEPAGSVFVVFRSQPPGDHLVAVERKGSATAEPEPKRAKLRILEAVYGPSESAADVTATVKSLVAGGAREIRAGNELAEDDPAPGVVKRLRVQFLLNGGTQSAETREGQALELPAGAEVIKALYGDLRPGTASRAQSVDLTQKLAALVKHDELEVQVDNQLAGGDPAYLVPKELRVEYSLDDARKSTIIEENDVLALPDSDRPLGVPPPFAFGRGPEGQMQLLAWAPGEFTFRWASGSKTDAACKLLPAPVQIAGPWTVSFPSGWAAPANVSLERLQSWTDHTNPGVKYFSGTATYEKELEVPPDWLRPGYSVCLDLGAVKNFAEVSLNGKPLGILWKPPFRVDITGAAKPGRNTLTVKVTNLWPNRLIGDEQLPSDCEWNGKELKAWPPWLLEGKSSPTGRLTFTTWHHWTKDAPLLTSGLLGPVRLRLAETVVPR